MTSSPTERVIEAVEAETRHPARRSGSSWKALCPAHDDRTPSLSISEGDDGRALVRCFTGCTTEAILDALGLQPRDLFEPSSSNGSWQIVETYSYVDEKGEELSQVVRFEPKDFRQRRSDHRGGYTWNLGDTRRVLYRLPQVLAAAAVGETVILCEGERDVHAAEKCGYPATTNPGGAGKWRPEYSDALLGAHVIVVADNDKPGRAHGRQVAAALEGIAASVVVKIPTKGSDLTEHIAAGGSFDDLEPMLDEEGEGLEPPSETTGFRIVTAAEFANEEEDSAEPLLGTRESAALPAGGDLLMYGDAGTGKITKSIDLLAHAAAGISWLGIEIVRPLRVLLVEAEGPRGPFRQKIRRKIDTWAGPPFAHNLFVLEEPWARFTFADESHRALLAAAVLEHEIDIVAVGPLAVVGTVGGGTPEEITAFDLLIRDVRGRVGRPIAFIFVHHENKAGDVSGAWARLPDTLVHVRLQHGRDGSILHWRKTRWSSELHGRTMTLRWLTETEGFELVDSEKASAGRHAAELEDATNWIVGYVTEHPGHPKTKVEKAYVDAHDGKGRNIARDAIDEQLRKLAEHKTGGEDIPLLATTTGERKNGFYLIPFTEVTSPLAAPLFGEDGEEVSDPVPRTPLATSPPPRRGGEEGGEKADGVAEEEPDIDEPDIDEPDIDGPLSRTEGEAT